MAARDVKPREVLKIDGRLPGEKATGCTSAESDHPPSPHLGS